MRAGTSSAKKQLESPRRFVIVFNRRRADPVNLRRAKRGLEEFVSQQMVDGDETMIHLDGAERRAALYDRAIPGSELS